MPQFDTNAQIRVQGSQRPPGLDTFRTWHTLTVGLAREAVAAPEGGLSPVEASARLAEYGPNEIDESVSDPWYVVLVRQLRSPMVLFLFAAAVVTAVQREWFEVIVISLVVVLNTSIGFWQTRKAAKDVKALAQLSTPVALVVRGGEPVRIPAPELVPGDTVRLESGDRVPADLRISESASLRIDESMLTGEVLPTSKTDTTVAAEASVGDRVNMAYSGTLVVYGRGTGIVVGTGERTELGAIAGLLQQDAGKTPLQILTDRLERTIGFALLGLAILVFGASVVMGTDVGEAFRTTVALVVSAMPEALPIVLSVAMGVGVSRMARRNAVVRNLPSVETLGSTNVIGSDKTGTLTLNRMTVERLWAPDEQMLDMADTDTAAASGSAPNPASSSAQLSAVQIQSLRTGALTNEATEHSDGNRLLGDSVDVAMAEAALRTRAVDPAERTTPPAAHMPYEPDLAYSQTIRKEDGLLVLHVKGAPEVIVGFCNSMAVGADAEWPAGSSAARLQTAPMKVDAISAANEAMAHEGLRVIATASAVLGFADEDAPPASGELPTPSELVFTGLQGMMDPPRPGVGGAIEECRAAGIHVMMITGDHPVTGSAIAKRLGLRGDLKPLTGAELATLDDDQLRERLAHTAVAARMSPQDKLRIVKLLRADDQIVAVTGDGVNDAPALKAASIGVAMGASGTDVARESADVVLTDDNFVTIVDAVRLGRVTFSSIRKATFFLVSNGLAAATAVVVNTFTELPLIFLPVMLLFMNVVTNGIQDIALSFEKGEGDELKQKPRPRGEGVLNTTMWVRTVITGLWMGFGTLLVYQMAHAAGLAVEECRTLALITMVMFNFFQVFSARAERKSVFQLNPLGNPLLVVSALAALALQWSVTVWPTAAELIGLVPLSAGQWLMCTVVGSTVLLLVEVEKLVRRIADRRHERQ